MSPLLQLRMRSPWRRHLGTGTALDAPPETSRGFFASQYAFPLREACHGREAGVRVYLG